MMEKAIVVLIYLLGVRVLHVSAENSAELPRICGENQYYDAQVERCAYKLSSKKEHPAGVASASGEHDEESKIPAESQDRPAEKAPASGEHDEESKIPAESQDRPTEKASGSGAHDEQSKIPAESQDRPAETAPASGEHDEESKIPAESQDRPAEKALASEENDGELIIPAETAPASGEHHEGSEIAAESQDNPAEEASASGEHHEESGLPAEQRDTIVEIDRQEDGPEEIKMKMQENPDSNGGSEGTTSTPHNGAQVSSFSIQLFVLQFSILWSILLAY